MKLIKLIVLSLTLGIYSGAVLSEDCMSTLTNNTRQVITLKNTLGYYHQQWQLKHGDVVRGAQATSSTVIYIGSGDQQRTNFAWSCSSTNNTCKLMRKPNIAAGAYILQRNGEDWVVQAVP